MAREAPRTGKAPERPAVECLARPDKDVCSSAKIPKQAVGALCAPIRRLLGLGHDDHDVVVAVDP